MRVRRVRVAALWAVLLGVTLLTQAPAIAGDDEGPKTAAEKFAAFVERLEARMDKLQERLDKSTEDARKEAAKAEEEIADAEEKAAEDIEDAEERFEEELEKIESKLEEELDKAKDEKEQDKAEEKRLKALAKAKEDKAKALDDLEKSRRKALDKIFDVLAKWEKKQAKILAKMGEINPTNIAVTDLDVEFNCVYDQPAADLIQARSAHELSRGAGVVVAVLDGGFNLFHPMISGRLMPFGYDAVDLDFDPEDRGNGFDDDGDGIVDAAVGHGTFVAGMVLMAAPDAWILPVRVVDDEGYGSEEQIAEGILFAIDMGADVINLSIEGGTDTGAIRSAIDHAEHEGITVVVSAGNGGMDELGDVAEQNDTISVGAVDGADRLAGFSNVDEKKLDVFAPGVDLYGPYGWPFDDAMCVWSGTSFSSGIVSGAVALLLSRHPEFSPEMVKEEISAAVDPVWDEDGNLLSGRGRINLRTVAER